MTKKAAIFYITNEYVDYNKLNIRKQIEDIMEDPNNFQLKEFNTNEEMFKIIHDSMNDSNVCVSGYNIFETKNTIYVGYFISYDEYIDHNKSDSEQTKHAKNTTLNMFGTQITFNQVVSNLVIIKNNLEYTINGNNIITHSQADTITQYELIDIIEKIFIKNGIVVNIDESIDIYQYINNPFEHLILTDPEYEQHYIYHEYEVYTHVLIVIADVREKNGKINEKATLLCNKPIKGKVFVALYKKPNFNENPPYINLNIERFNNILNIRKISANLTEGTTNTEREYVNFDKLLQLENDKYKNTPTLKISQINGECLNNK